MEPDRWEQIERLYHAALERRPDGRDAFLEEACGGDEDLRREVAGLLECDLPSDGFIQSPAIEIAARALAAEPLNAAAAAGSNVRPFDGSSRVTSYSQLSRMFVRGSRITAASLFPSGEKQGSW